MLISLLYTSSIGFISLSNDIFNIAKTLENNQLNVNIIPYKKLNYPNFRMYVHKYRIIYNLNQNATNLLIRPSKSKNR